MKSIKVNTVRFHVSSTHFYRHLRPPFSAHSDRRILLSRRNKVKKLVNSHSPLQNAGVDEKTYPGGDTGHHQAHARRRQHFFIFFFSFPLAEPPSRISIDVSPLNIRLTFNYRSIDPLDDPSFSFLSKRWTKRWEKFRKATSSPGLILQVLNSPRRETRNYFCPQTLMTDFDDSSFPISSVNVYLRYGR